MPGLRGELAGQGGMGAAYPQYVIYVRLRVQRRPSSGTRGRMNVAACAHTRLGQREGRMPVHEIICSHCGKEFTIDEARYADILKQVRDSEFEQQLHVLCAPGHRWESVLFRAFHNRNRSVW